MPLAPTAHRPSTYRNAAGSHGSHPLLFSRHTLAPPPLMLSPLRFSVCSYVAVVLLAAAIGASQM